MYSKGKIAISAVAAGLLACSGHSTAGGIAAPATEPKPASRVLLSTARPPRLPPPTDLSCVQPPVVGHDDEPPWTVKLGERLHAQAASLARCTEQLPVSESELTLRLVYQSDGTPLSQHVAQASAASCAVAQCLIEGLQNVWGPKQADVDPVSYDFQLAVQRGAAPQWTGAVIDPLVAESPGATCVDPDLQRLSKKQVYAQVSTTFPELKKCHAEAVARDRLAAGRVTFEFVIGQDGQVSKARARESTLYDCEAIECMKAQFRTLSFAPPVGRPIPVIFPIEFTVEQSSVAFQ